MFLLHLQAVQENVNEVVDDTDTSRNEINYQRTLTKEWPRQLCHSKREALALEKAINGGEEET